jgi:hypothetical protein
MTTDNKPLDPHKTLCVCYFKGKKVGSIPATAPNAEAYITELARQYGELNVDYEPDPTGGLLNALHQNTR